MAEREEKTRGGVAPNQSTNDDGDMMEDQPSIWFSSDEDTEGEDSMIELVSETQEDLGDSPKILVLGVGGAGVNAVDNMSVQGLKDVSFLAVNTDAQALSLSSSPRKLLIGRNVTKNLGTGGNPYLGEQAALEDRDALREAMEGSDLVFITAGLGGGTGSGASPVLAEIAKEAGALTVAITTKPFDFEGPQRRRHADTGQVELRKRVDTLITIPNQRLLKIVDEKMPIMEAFKVADSVLMQCVQSISDLITEPGQMNLDFADIKTIMDNTGGAVMGVGFGRGEDKCRQAFSQACSSPLMEEVVVEGAKGILVNLTAGPDITLYEVNTSMEEFINSKADPEANIIFGMVIHEDMAEEAKVTILATGFTREEKQAAESREATRTEQPHQPSQPQQQSRQRVSYEQPAYLNKEGSPFTRREPEERVQPAPRDREREHKPQEEEENQSLPAIFGFK
jgi:cell division protein FtsZ